MAAENLPDRTDAASQLTGNSGTTKNNLLQFPSLAPWDTPVHGAGLLEAIAAMIRRYVVCPSHIADTLALWTLHTYAFELRRVTTYIGVVSPQKRCGKTTLLTLLSALVNRPIVAANISPPALFRVIEEAQPTLLIDEADTFMHGNEELRGILNAGYSRETAYVVRVANREQRERSTSNVQLSTIHENEEGRMTNPSRLVKFSCWCPKMMAAIGRLPETLADRCIMITMQRKSGEEQCERLREVEATELRRRCVRLVGDNAETIASWRPEIPPALNDRAADIWEPLLVLADLAGSDWPARARAAAAKLSEREEEESQIGMLLLYIQCLFRETGAEKFFSRTIVEAVAQFRVRPWEEGRKGKPIDEQWLAKQLRPYGIQPRMMWIDGRGARGYLREDFAEVFGRYLPAVPESLKKWLEGNESSPTNEGRQPETGKTGEEEAA